ncbi:MAG: DNA polymerase III subunit delta [Gammaproteobacteria bacterium]|nr:DNA polymerase III subunit delta [Gammaproteobacteria bacterium]
MSVCSLIALLAQMKVNSDALPGRLARTLDSVYLVSGDDPLLVGETSDLIRKRAYKDGFTGRNLHVVERGFDWNQLMTSSNNLSLFDDRCMTEIRLPTGKPGKRGAQALVEFADNISSDDCLLVIVPKFQRGSASTAWVKKLEAVGVVVQVWPINAQQLPGWIAARVKQAGLKASRDAIAMLADRSQGNLLAAQQEITKLSLYFPDGNVGTEDVARSVADSARFDVFQLVDAALVGDVDRSLRMLSGLQSEGVEPVLILWALTREIRTLFSVHHAIGTGVPLDAALTRARVWSTRKALVNRAVRRFKSTAAVGGLLELAAVTDAIIKGRRTGDRWSALRALVVGLSQGQVVVTAA